MPSNLANVLALIERTENMLLYLELSVPYNLGTTIEILENCAQVLEELGHTGSATALRGRIEKYSSPGE